MVVAIGVMMDIPAGYVVKLWAKSRSEFLVGAGVVDSGYQGEIKVRVFNPSLKQVAIKKGEAIAQAVILQCETPEVEIVAVQDLFEEESKRGASGGIHL
jgi:dUTP pyrophosphatase